MIEQPVDRAALKLLVGEVEPYSGPYPVWQIVRVVSLRVLGWSTPDIASRMAVPLPDVQDIVDKFHRHIVNLEGLPEGVRAQHYLDRLEIALGGLETK